MMNICPLMQDLLPLYLDGEVSPDTRRAIEAHLPECPGCRQRLASLRAPLPPALRESGPEAPGAASAGDARFLRRLRRQAGTALGLVLLIITLTAFGANRYGQWSRDREHARRIAAERQREQDALAALRDLSPNPAALLAARGVKLEARAVRRGGDEVAVTYTADWVSSSTVKHLFTVHAPYSRGPWLRDPETGAELERSGGQSQWGQGRGSGTYRFRVPDRTGQVAYEYPALLAYLTPPADLPRWEFRRPGPAGWVDLDAPVTVHGIDFVVNRVEFAGDTVRAWYRQLTDPAQVGVHYLSFRLSDGLGGGWGAMPLETLPDPGQPHQEFSVIHSPSQNWSLAVEYAVLAVPGPQLTLEVMGNEN